MKTQSIKLFITFITLMVLGFFPALVGATGLSVTPSKLVVDTNKRDNEVTLTVENISSDVSLFEVYADESKKMFEIKPESFVLESGQSRKVTVSVSDKTQPLVQTDISIVSQMMATSGFVFGSGIKIPITVHAGDGRSGLLASVLFATPVTKIMIFVLAGLILLGVIVFMSKRFYSKKT